MAMTGGGGGSIAGQDHGLLSGLTDDDHTQYLRLLGRTSGQVIGSGAHTGGNATDIALEGRLLLGNAITGINFSAGRQLHIVGSLLNNSTFTMIQPFLSGLTGTASGSIVLFQVLPTGTMGYTGGTLNTFRGFNFTATIPIPAGVTFTETSGGLFQTAIGQENTTGHAATVFGLKAYALGTASGANPTVSTICAGIECGANPRQKPTDNAYAVKCLSPAGGVANLTNSFGFYIAEGYLDTPGVTNWYGVYVEFPPNPINKFGIYQKNTNGTNRLEADTIFGALTAPNSTVHNNGNQSLKITANKTTAYTVARETFIPCDANTVGAFAVTLPTAVGIPGRIYVIKKVDASANAITVTSAGAETIDGAATVVLNAQWQVVRVVSDGANWLIW